MRRAVVRLAVEALVFQKQHRVVERIAVRSRPQARSSAFEGITTRSPGMWVNSTSPHWLW
jgi:hypothetical protein